MIIEFVGYRCPPKIRMAQRRSRLDDKPEGDVLEVLLNRPETEKLVEATRGELLEGFMELQLQYPNAGFEEIMDMFIQENPGVFEEYKQFVSNVFDETGSFKVSRNPFRKD